MARMFPPPLKANGFNLIDPGRFTQTTTDYTAQIAHFKQANVEIVTGSSRLTTSQISGSRRRNRGTGQRSAPWPKHPYSRRRSVRTASSEWG